MAEAERVWLKARPQEALVTERVVLRRFRPVHAAALADAVNESLDHLRPWMAWATVPVSAGDEETVLREAEAKFDAGTEFAFLIFSQDDQVVGACGLHPRRGPGVLEIGYWVRVGHTGRGYAKAAIRRLVDEAFALPEVEHVQIRCDAANVASAAIPRRLGFNLVRVEDREPRTPAETARELVWVLTREELELSVV